MIADPKPYPAMKDSGVPWLGEVPEHWEAQKLRNLLDRVTERSRPDLPLLSVVREKGVISRDITGGDDNHNFIPDDLTNYKVVRPGQFAMNKMKAWQGSYGVSPHAGIVSPAYFVFSLHGVEATFFHVAIRSRTYVPFFAQASDGVRIGQWDLSQGRMKEILFIVPSVAEQAAIVRFLDHVDRRIRRYIRAKQKLISLLEEQKRAIIHRAVTRGLDPNCRLKPSGVEWLGDVPEHWEVKRLKWVTRLQRGYDLPADQREPGPFPVVSSGGVIDTHSESKCVGPGVVMGRYGSTDAVFYVEQDFWPHNTSLFVTDFQGNLPRWCFHLLGSVTKADHAGKSAVPGVDRKDLFQIVVALPPVGEQLELVRSIGARSRSLNDAISTAQREVALLREYRTRLIADVVTGKVDVREAAARLPDEVEKPVFPAEDDALTDDSEGETSEDVDALPEEGAGA